jgi:hypothetical protein
MIESEKDAESGKITTWSVMRRSTRALWIVDVFLWASGFLVHAIGR